MALAVSPIDMGDVEMRKLVNLMRRGTVAGGAFVW
jgi:hypothetical protein